MRPKLIKLINDTNELPTSVASHHILSHSLHPAGDIDHQTSTVYIYIKYKV